MLHFRKKKTESCDRIAFFWIEDSFIEYRWPEYIDDYGYSLSVFEVEESAYNPEVIQKDTRGFCLWFFNYHKN